MPDNNGRVGILGISYGGWLTRHGACSIRTRRCKAVSEQASPADMFLGDDFHHNGAFRLSYGFEYAAMMETAKTNFHFQFDRYDTFDWYLALGPLANVNSEVPARRHSDLERFRRTIPNYDAFWQKQAVCAVPEAGHRAEAERGRLVGPGGLSTVR